MAQRKVKGEFIAECDDCGAELYGGCIDDWQEWVDEMRKHGWTSVKEGDAWAHYCPDCKG